MATLPAAQSNPTTTWTQMVRDALNMRNRFAPGTPDYQKWNQLYISRAQHLRSLQQGSATPASMSTPTRMPPTPTMQSSPSIPMMRPAPSAPTRMPMSSPTFMPQRTPMSYAPSPRPSITTPQFQPMPRPSQVPIYRPTTVPRSMSPSTPTPTSTAAKPTAPNPNPTLIGPTPGQQTPISQQVIPPVGASPEQSYDDKSTTPPPQTTPPDDPSDLAKQIAAASETARLEYLFKTRQLTLDDKFRYYAEGNKDKEFLANLAASLEKLRDDYAIQGKQLDINQQQVVGDLENRATELANNLQMGMSQVDAQRAVAELQAQVQERLGMAGLEEDLNKSMAGIEAQTLTGLTGMYLQNEQAAGQLGLQRQLGLTELGTGLAGQLAGQRSQERMAGINAVGQMAPTMRSISAQERQGFAGKAADLASQSLGVNAQRESELMRMGLGARQAIRQAETERQLGLTGQTVQAYQTLAQMNQQPENWLSAFYAMRGMGVPPSARTGQAQSLGQFAQDLAREGLRINPGNEAVADPLAYEAFRKGAATSPNELHGSMDRIYGQFANAGFGGLENERERANIQTGRMYDIGEYGRTQDANMIQGLTGQLTGEALNPRANKTLGMPGYDSQPMYNRLNPLLNRADYYNPNQQGDFYDNTQWNPTQMDEMNYQDWQNQPDLTMQDSNSGPQDELNYQDWNQQDDLSMFQPYDNSAPQNEYNWQDYQDYMQPMRQPPQRMPAGVY